ncbi:hypothetical protein L3Y25_gp125 [Gordonia phage Syleon]|uniref:Uncharacterized protein n=3 Tax=Octobienvirus TaxID=3044779 RepID=A0AAE9C2Y0_9CAUD|nr:hypothetical protein L3Y23_gp120 [Gordonia Phage Sephiroth]YP_010246628.1 hypothetical protein L3Y24_gp128 [Gordonia phage Kudefre]YP_010246769.1 hypothetical protein L3Y25_gp125 [Gordonia phage Syleon]QGH75839.1 hypothetical protein SEA_SYLEON_116 [Gordonia phage Syleon]QNN99445.1 hypothetical protein SEA_SEPHIROTH_111 [Gordonia Phage Sephiroth]UDL15333.1 hypothetical protein SEA_KUDEFRE_115 [Gordonia phage Kudefre]
MTACVVGQKLDNDDKAALPELLKRYKRNFLHATLVRANGGVQPFGLTAFKDHLNERCVCYGRIGSAA